MHCDESKTFSTFSDVSPRPGFDWLNRLCLLLSVVAAGCGTTRISDTMRTGTEQMLLSSAIERAVNDMDFSMLEGKDVYFDPQYLKGVSDEGYIVSSIRQRLLAEGALLKAIRDDAVYVVEARAGTVGTNRQDVLIGMPQVTLPTGAMMAGVPSAIPEIPLAKKTQQRGVVKLSAFAYNQVTGQGVWQSGTHPITADSRDTWILGTGPFQHGSIYNGTNFAGQRVRLFGRGSKSEMHIPAPGISITAAASFTEDPKLLAAKLQARALAKEKETREGKDSKATLASFTPGTTAPSQSNIPAAASSGFTSSTFTGHGLPDAKATSGGSAAAAGLMIFQQRNSQPQ